MEYNRLKEENNVDAETGFLYHYAQGGECINPHCHDFYEIFVTVCGNVEHWINGKTTILPEGSMVFIRPDVAHAYTCSSDEAKKASYMNFAFTAETVEKMFEYLSDGFPAKALLEAPMPPTIFLTSEQKRRIVAHVEELNTVNFKDKKQQKLRARVLLADIFARYFANYTQKKEETDIPQWLNELAEEMESTENFVAGADRMVELCKKSREHLSRNVKKYFGKTLSEYVNDLRVNYAANLLLNTNTPVLDICFDCGFQNVSWFYDVFREKYGMSPNKFRKEYEK